MNRIWSTISVLALAAVSFAQTSVFNPARSVKDQNITLRGWGSGTIAETDEVSYEGAFSVRVSTRNLFQGGLMSLGSPVDWAAAFGDDSNMLRLAFRVADGPMTLGGGGGGGAGLKGGGGGGRPGSPDGDTGGQLGGGGGRNPGSGGGAAGGGQMTQTAAPLKRIRVIMTTTDGMKSEAYIPVANASADSRGWQSVAIPLKRIDGFAKTNKIIKELGFSGDATTTFYVGDMRVVSDQTPISGEIKTGNLNLALNDEVEFRGSGFGGSSVLKFTWDFDDKDGIQEDAEGVVVKRKFRKAGTYKVTLTVSDMYGLKKSASSSINVVVNP
ncbi:MAG TPA: PKD domain-containing protein [Fimbriimonadaceae bacterium]|nr:PKD domain-containing protein [Fimbriimonadaceae bacterium]